MKNKTKYIVDVLVNQEFLDNPEEKIHIKMTSSFDNEQISTLNFISNNAHVNKELFVALDIMELWVKQGLSHQEIINKLIGLDQLQYGSNLACNEIGQTIAKLYSQYVTDIQASASA